MAQATEHRRQRILSELLDHKHVTIRGLAVELGLSEATVRRDLKVLADERQLTLVHGGATLPRNGDYSLQAKRFRQVAEKQTIGQTAARLVGDGEQIYLDSGTTCFAMLPELRRRQGLTILTNSIRIANELAAPGGSGISVLTLGGQFRGDRLDTVGPLALSTLDQLRGYVAFLGADGVSMDFGPSAADVDSAHLHRQVVERAREAILLVDHTKFAAPSLFRIVAWDAISRVVTDQPPPPDWRAFLDERGIQIVLPQPESQETPDSTQPSAETQHA